jgi:hypothetical protein
MYGISKPYNTEYRYIWNGHVDVTRHVVNKIDLPSYVRDDIIPIKVVKKVFTDYPERYTKK